MEKSNATSWSGCGAISPETERMSFLIREDLFQSAKLVLSVSKYPRSIFFLKSGGDSPGPPRKNIAGQKGVGKTAPQCRTAKKQMGSIFSDIHRASSISSGRRTFLSQNRRKNLPPPGSAVSAASCRKRDY